MTKIPIRKIDLTQGEQNYSKIFQVKDISKVMNGQPLIEPFHRHNFFFILALERGKGDHNVFFKTYEITDYSLLN